MVVHAHEMRTLLAMLETEEAHELICEAYAFGFPLVLMDASRQVMTDVSAPDHERAPVNQFAHGTRAVRSSHVRFPNTDVFPSVAWLNLAREPVVLSVPDIHDRYYSMHLSDAWATVFASIGSRTSGDSTGDIAIIGPGWPGSIKRGLKTIESPTNVARLIARIESTTAKDDAVVHELQRRIGLMPLGLWGRDYQPLRHAPMPRGLDVSLSPAERIAAMPGSEFFQHLNMLMIENPPAPRDGPALNRFSLIGIGPGLPFHVKDDVALSRSIDTSAHTALARIVVDAKKPSGRSVNGWWMPDCANRDGDYVRRAANALRDLGAAPPEDGITLRADADTHGRPLSGIDRYLLRFLDGQLPPVHGLWSLAMYNTRDGLVQNRLGRHAITSRQRLTFGRDGTLTIYIQHESPGRARESNWLPAPRDHFILSMRLYWPGPEFLEDAWTPPAIERI